jgi:hypothetical protein
MSRIKCKTCENTILESTASITGGICMPCKKSNEGNYFLPSSPQHSNYNYSGEKVDKDGNILYEDLEEKKTKSKKFTDVNQIFDPLLDKDSLCWDLCYEIELDFRNSGEIQGLAHDLSHLQSEINPNGISTYFDNMEDVKMVEQALESLKTICSSNYELIKNALTKVEINEDGYIETENYDDSEDWDKWSYDDTELLLAYIEKNKSKYS